MQAGVQFYQLLHTPLERAVPKLVEKAYSAGHRVHIMLGSDEQVQHVNEVLWTYDPASFLPHGTRKEAQPERQPIYLSAALDAPNQPTVLFVTEGSAIADTHAYVRILDLFSGHDPDAIAGARSRWKRYKEAGCDTTYFRQSESGGWQPVLKE